MRLIFFGTPEFASTSLKAIVDAGFNVVGVVTAPDKQAGRGRKIQSSHVKETALKLGIPVAQPTNLKAESFQEQLQKWNPDLGIVIAFRMLPEKVWSFPKLGTVNLHGSILPKYRGAAPIHHAIINGERETGVSTFFLKHEIDTGNLIQTAQIEIPNDMNTGELHDKLMHLGAETMVNTIKLIAEHGKETPSFPQGEITETTPVAPKLNRDFCELDISQNAETIYNKIRGLAPFPGAWINSEFGILKIYSAEISDHSSSNKEPVYVENQHLWLNSKDHPLKIIALQPQGKPKMGAKDYINGLKNKS